ncbi:MAG: hypothetical protein B6I20_04160 [Bacteroidetes bacterium 4572_117]|nr:MAG: hypothetical protein B6I20_04160 [Bacteroidetes bacterium 4572_117]
MARKSFKSGLGSLIQDSRVENQEEKVKEVAVHDEKLMLKINELNDELHLWRTGKLTVDIFEKSLKENKLKYNKKENSFTIIEL